MFEWVAKFKFPGKKEAYFGTFQAETELAAEKLAYEAWAKVFPIPAPAVFTMYKGSMRLELE